MRPGARTSRGFALALVMLVSMVSVLTVAVMLERSAQATRAARRGEELYLRHHEQAGMRDMIGMAMAYRALNVGEMKPGGTAGVVLAVEGRGEVVIRVADGQGAILAAAGDGAAAVLRTAAERVAEVDPQGTAAGRNTRLRGPAKTSVHAAPRAVLEALYKAVDPEGPGGAFAAAVQEARAGKRMSANDIAAALRTAGAPEEAAGFIQGLFTSEASLYRVRVESRGPGGRAVPGGRFEGLIQGDPRGGAGGAHWAFLEWKRLEEGDAWTADEALDAGDR